MSRLRFPALFGLFIAASLGTAPETQASALPPPVAYVLKSLQVPEDALSIWVRDVQQPGALLEVNVETPRNPASAMKLVTTFAALESLGPAYTWRTEVYLTTPPKKGHVTGDVWIRGHGDPYFVMEEAWKFIAELKQRGIVTVGGDLVFDDGYFEPRSRNRGAFDGQPDRIYNALPHPLLVNFNAVKFLVHPGDDVPAAVTIDPPLPNLKVDNRLRIRPGPCTGFQRGVALTLVDTVHRDRAVLEGRFPAGCSEYELTRSVLQPESYAYGLFTLYWRQLGGDVKGGFRRGAPPADAGGPFFVHRSRSLGDVVRLVNKFSNNVMTLNFELTLGAERFGEPGTPDKGRRAILEVLEKRGIATEGLVIDNSAGLSRNVRISAAQLGGVLSSAWRSPYMPEFVSSLALSGLDGTMRNRFVGGVEQGRMHLKTGTLDNVSAVAGYVTAASGRRFMVVMLLNSPGAHRGPGEELQNALLRWVYRL